METVGILSNQNVSSGEGNGNPLQCSCLENPRDRGAWWAAVYGVSQESDTTEATQQLSSRKTWTLSRSLESPQHLGHCLNKVVVQSSCVQLFVTPWTVACQVPLSKGFLRQEYRSGLPFPSAGHLSNIRIEPASPALAGKFFTTAPPGKPWKKSIILLYT